MLRGPKHSKIEDVAPKEEEEEEEENIISFRDICLFYSAARHSEFQQYCKGKISLYQLRITNQILSQILSADLRKKNSKFISRHSKLLLYRCLNKLQSHAR